MLNTVGVMLLFEHRDGIWCLSCGFSLFTNDGLTKDGRQKLKCSCCGRRTINGALLQGQRLFDKNNLLPFLLKNTQDLTPGELYSLGFILADGCVTTHTRSLSCRLNICILKKDKEILDIIQQELKIPSKYKNYTKKDTGQEISILSWQCKYAEPFLEKFGLVKNKTGKELWLPSMEDANFIRGFFDGDGCVYVNKEKFKYEMSFTSGGRQFLDSLSNYLMQTLNIKPYFNLQKNKTGQSWRIIYYTKSSEALGEFLYQNSEGLRLERKYQKYLEIKNRHNKNI